jgi:ankyrin
MRLLIEHGADLQARTKRGFSALHFAARDGDLDATQLLLDAGVDVNIRSQPDPSEKGGGPTYDATISGGSTPLLVATVRGHLELAEFLLDRGANPNLLDAGYTPLHWAAATWESEIANPSFGIDGDSMSGIHDREGKLRLVKALLAHGADPNARATRRPPAFAGGYSEVVGATPFLLASASADIEMMRLLLAAGADAKTPTKTNTTPVMAAAGVFRRLGESPVTEDQALEAVKLLLDLGADVKTVTTTGEGVLLGPAYHGWNTLLQLLVEKGADVNAVSAAGITPWLAASGQGDRQGGVRYNRETAELLISLGADPKLGTPCMAQGRCRAPATAPAK